MKQKLSIDDQIQHMKEKGIKFELASEEYAKGYLQNNTYYFKIKSYAKSFEKSTKKDTYINVDFAYLEEMAKLDMYLRKYILNLSLDVEHLLKVQLTRDLTNNPNEDGYSIVINNFLINNSYIIDDINHKKTNSASADLIHKYETNWSVWTIIEVLSFGDFIKLYKLYYETYPTKNSKKIINLLWSLKFLRNASAHNNCLLNSLRKPYQHTHLLKDGSIKGTKTLSALVANIKTIGKSSRQSKLINPIIHDLTSSLFLLDLIDVNDNLKKHNFEDLNDLLTNRFIRHKEYFEHDNVILSSYRFIKNVLDYLYKKNI